MADLENEGYEPGLSEYDLAEHGKALGKKVEAYGKELERTPVNFYCVFKNSADRDRAKWYVGEDCRNQEAYNGLFYDFETYDIDPGQKETGLEIKFRRNKNGSEELNLKDLKGRLNDYFAEKGVDPVAIYPSIQGDLTVQQAAPKESGPLFKALPTIVKKPAGRKPDSQDKDLPMAA